MKRFSRYLFHPIEGVVIAVTVVMSVVVFLQVLLRYILDQPFGWTEEMGRITFLVFVLLGAVLAYRDNQHLGLDILENRLSGVTLLFFVAVKRVLVILFAVIMIQQGVVLINSLFAQTPILGVPFSKLYLIFPITMILILMMALAQFFGDIRKIYLYYKKGAAGSPIQSGGGAPGRGPSASLD
jgi:TRAP-type C4-dicarboxylate transport system permease small subunit